MNNNDNRRFERNEIHKKLAYRLASDTDFKQGKTGNISRGGLLLNSREMIPQGEALDLVIKIDETPIHLKGKCIYSKGTAQEGFLSGVQVLKVNTAGMETYLAFITRQEKKRAEKNHNLRSEHATMENVVQRMSAEHKIIIQYVGGLREMLSAQDPHAESAEYEAILNLMSPDLTTHFNIEEKIFFKIGLTHLPSKYHDLIGELTREHEEMKHELNQIIDSVEEFSRKNAPIDEKIKTRLKSFLEQLKEHARKEIIDLFPLMEENEQVKSKVLSTLRDAMKK